MNKDVQRHFSSRVITDEELLRIDREVNSGWTARVVNYSLDRALVDWRGRDGRVVMAVVYTGCRTFVDAGSVRDGVDD